MWSKQAILALFSASLAFAQDEGNETAPFPDTVYEGFVDPEAAAGAVYGQFGPESFPAPWIAGLGDWGDAYQRAQEFVGQLTLAEKVNLTTGVGWQSARCVGEVGAIPRLDFRGLCLQDSPMGIRFAEYVSAFPGGVTTGTTWDRGLIRERGRQMGEEHKNKGVDVQLGPAIGPLGRSPAGGRNWEGFSHDPYLEGAAVYETVKGIQESNVIACTKHWIMNEQERFRQVPEANGYGFNITETVSVNIDDTTMHEVYMWPFADAVRAGTGSIMCSYQQINNSYGCDNSYTMNHLLKGELGFQGFVLSDWQAQHSGYGSAFSGLDMSMPGDTSFNTGYSFWGTNLTIAVLNGTVPEYRVDDMATRIMAAFYYVGRDEAQIDINFSSWTRREFGYLRYFAEEGFQLLNERVNVQANHAAFIREMAAKGTVLLKNENQALPLKGDEQFVAIIGEDAGPNPRGANGCPDRGCNDGTLAQGWGSGTAEYPYLITPYEAIQRRALEGGAGIVEGLFDNYDEGHIQDVAEQATVALVFINANSGEGYISVDGNEGDRQNLTAWGNGDELVEMVTAYCDNTIVTIHAVGPITMPWYDNPNVTAILFAGLPGQESGNSITDILYGRQNPGGKLPFTIGARRQDYGNDLLYFQNGDIPQIQVEEGVFLDYRAFDKAGIDPIYEFGYGLSYTTFEYSDLSITPIEAGEYVPNSGFTEEAPVLGTPGQAEDFTYEADGITPVPFFIYPYLNGTDLEEASQDPDYGNPIIPEGAQDSSPQPVLPAGGAPGGNAQLYDILYEVRATVTNTGDYDGDEVAELYINHGGPDQPAVVLRGFDRMHLACGESREYVFQLTRRDVSNWDTVSQNWVITDYPKTVFVGASSRNLPLQATLPANLPSFDGGNGGDAEEGQGPGQDYGKCSKCSSGHGGHGGHGYGNHTN